MFLDKLVEEDSILSLLRNYRKLSNHNLSIAGGIKTEQEIKQLSRMGFVGVLSTMIHKKLSRDSILLSP